VSLCDNGSHEAALDAGAEAEALARQINDPVLLGSVLFRHGYVLDEADVERAECVYLEALGLAERSGDIETESSVHNNYALVLMDQGNLSDARRHLDAALDLAGNTLNYRTASMHSNLAWVLLQEGEPQRSASYQSAVLRSARLDGVTSIFPYAVLGLACCATEQGAPERGALLHGGADALLSAISGRWEALEGKLRDRYEAVLRERLGDDFERLHSEGLAMPHDQIVKLALSGR
jgi:tetratricopeptide (TPR) repeat protein